MPGVPDSAAPCPVAAFDTAISSHGASTIGSKLGASEPRNSSKQICCIHVVPHLGYVAITTSVDASVNLARNSCTAAQWVSNGWITEPMSDSSTT